MSALPDFASANLLVFMRH